MTHEEKSRRSGTNGWLIATGVAVLLALALGPALAGTASAAPVPTNTPAAQWAYGGQENASGTIQSGANSVVWNATFGWTVIFTATNTSNTTVQLEVQRTVGVSLTTTVTLVNATATYTYHATESDLAFVNLTDAASVYVNGVATPALGLTNESLHVAATVDQTLHLAHAGHTSSGWLNASGEAQGTVAFAPALGLVPLNLSGVSAWNSSSTASPAASWNISYAYADLGWNGSSHSGSGSSIGNWSVSGPVSLTGLKVTVVHPFSDHRSRTAILLIVHGPVDAYDGYVLVPHDFDLFGGAQHAYDADSLGSASVGSGQGETLYVSPGARGPTVTAADSTFGATPGADVAIGQPSSGPSPALGSSPGATVQGQPMTVPAAQAESACLTSGCPASAGSVPDSVLGLAVLGLAVVAVVGTVAVIEWRSYARRRSQKGLVGGYSEAWTNGVPPAGSQAPMAPEAPSVGPEGPQARR